MLSCQVNNVDIDLIFSDSIEENIISINSKKELFFDIYECFISDKKLILEKVGDSDLGPKVLLEVNIDSKKYSAEAILVDNGKNYVELNEENIYFIRTIPEENLTVEKNEIEEVNIDNETPDNIEVNYENIIEHHVNNKLVFLHELEEQFEEKIVSLKDDISNKLDLFFEKLEDKKKIIIEEKLEKITTELDEKFILLQSELHGVEDFSKKNIDSILEKKVNEIDSSVNVFLEGITKEYKNKIISSDKKITHNFLELNSIKDKLKENNSLTNKKFEDLNILKEKLLEQDELVLKNKELKKFISEEFESIDNKFKNLSEEENKKYEELLAAVNNKDVVEYKTILKEKIQDVELTQIKESLQDEISNSLRGDIVSLKRYVEMSSGGGSIAKQFALGGTMDGDLIVVGNLSASNYLGIDSFDSGGTMDGDLNVSGTIKADTILATSILSSTQLDIGFELSGFNVTGDLSASGGLSAKNINVAGDILPSETTTFNIGSSALRFKDIFLAGSTIDLSGTKISTDGEGDIEFRDRNNLPKRIKASEIVLESSNDPDNDIVFKVDSGGNPEFQKRQRSNPNIIQPSTTISDIVSAVQVRVRDVVGIGTSPGQLPNKPLTVVGDISATGNISSSNNLELGGNIVDTDANEIITIAGNDVCFTGKSIRAGQSLGLRGVRGNSKGLDQSGGSDHTKLGIFNCSIEAITLDTAGNVGIGTTSPDSTLHLSSSGPTILTIEADTDNVTETDNARIVFKQDGGAVIGRIGYKSNTNSLEFINQFAENLSLGTNNTERMRINSAGNVGIGTTTPSVNLHVVEGEGTVPTLGSEVAVFQNNDNTSDNLGIGLIAGTAGNAFIHFGDADSNNQGAITFKNTSNDLAFKTNATERMTIDSAGNVGIGTTSPVQDLELNKNNANVNLNIRSSNAGKATLLFGDQSDVSTGSVTYDNSDDSMHFKVNNQQEKMRITSAGKVGVGTTSPSEALTVNGSISGNNNLTVRGITSTSGTIAGQNLNINTQADFNTATFNGGVDFDDQTNFNGSVEFGDEVIFNSDTSVGFDAEVNFNNNIIVGAGLVPTLKVDSTNNKVGIGTTTPNEALTVNGGISAADINSFGTISIGNTPAYSQTRAIKVHDNGTQYASRVSLMGTGDNAGPAIEFVTDGSLAKRTLIRHEGEGSNDYGLGFFTTNNGTISESVRFDGDGKVGIGTTSPSSKLHIAGASGSGSGLEFSNAGSQSVKAYFIDSNSSSDFVITRVGTGAAEISLQSDGEVILNPNNNNVGIGTTSPSQLLHVSGGKALVEQTSSAGSVIVNRTDGKSTALVAAGLESALLYDSAGFFSIQARSSSDVLVGNGNTNDEVIRIDSSGNVGIGRSDPSKLLDIKDGDFRISSTEPKIFLNDTNNNSDFSIKNNNGSFQISDTTNGPTRLAIDSSGNVGIGTNSPNEALTVVGSISATGTTNVGKITLTENTFLTAASSFTLGDVHKGATVLLQNTGSINITVPSQVAGYTTTFIAETHNPVSFISGTGLSGLNSFNGASDIAGIYGQAQVIYKSAEYAFLGGNIV